MLPLLMVLGVGSVAIGVILLVKRAEKERTEQIRVVAERLGWGFRDEVPFSTIPDLDRFELFKQGHSRKLTNLLTSPAGDPRAVLFDYTYTVGGGKSQATYRQTVFYAASDSLQLPSFSLRPQHFGHTIAKAFGYQDIDIAHRPLFSGMFVLRGENEVRVRDVFGRAALAEFFEARSEICAAGTGREVLLWRAGKRVGGMEVERLMEDGFEVARLFGAVA